MKAICKKAFTTAGHDYKPGDEVEASEQRLKGWAWHGYVELPTTKDSIEKAAKDTAGIVGKATASAKAAMEAVGIKKKKNK